jgi:biopolymer transport protein ExbB
MKNSLINALVGTETRLNPGGRSMIDEIIHYSEHIIGFLAKGGVLMVPIIFISIVSVALLIERLWYYHRARCDVRGLYAQIVALIAEQRFEDAIELCGRYGRAVVAGALKCVLQNRQRPTEDIEKLVSVFGTREIQKLSHYVRFLGILGNITPLIGLLGTVVGMVKTFMSVAELSGHVNPSILAGGIWEALLTTAAGLMVAIPTIIIYHHFESTIDTFAFQIKNYSLELIEVLAEYD